jgi:hypothetical protein
MGPGFIKQREMFFFNVRFDEVSGEKFNDGVACKAIRREYHHDRHPASQGRNG